MSALSKLEKEIIYERASTFWKICNDDDVDAISEKKKTEYYNSPGSVDSICSVLQLDPVDEVMPINNIVSDHASVFIPVLRNAGGDEEFEECDYDVLSPIDVALSPMVNHLEKQMVFMFQSFVEDAKEKGLGIDDLTAEKFKEYWEI